MALGDLNTKKSWRTLIAELNSELGKWGLDDVILPTLREEER